MIEMTYLSIGINSGSLTLTSLRPPSPRKSGTAGRGHVFLVGVESEYTVIRDLGLLVFSLGIQ